MSDACFWMYSAVPVRWLAQQDIVPRRVINFADFAPEPVERGPAELGLDAEGAHRCCGRELGSGIGRIGV